MCHPRPLAQLIVADGSHMISSKRQRRDPVGCPEIVCASGWLENVNMLVVESTKTGAGAVWSGRHNLGTHIKIMSAAEIDPMPCGLCPCTMHFILPWYRGVFFCLDAHAAECLLHRFLPAFLGSANAAARTTSHRSSYSLASTSLSPQRVCSLEASPDWSLAPIITVTLNVGRSSVLLDE